MVPPSKRVAVKTCPFLCIFSSIVSTYLLPHIQELLEITKEVIKLSVFEALAKWINLLFQPGKIDWLYDTSRIKRNMKLQGCPIKERSRQYIICKEYLMPSLTLSVQPFNFGRSLSLLETKILQIINKHFFLALNTWLFHILYGCSLICATVKIVRIQYLTRSLIIGNDKKD